MVRCVSLRHCFSNSELMRPSHTMRFQPDFDCAQVKTVRLEAFPSPFNAAVLLARLKLWASTNVDERDYTGCARNQSLNLRQQSLLAVITRHLVISIVRDFVKRHGLAGFLKTWQCCHIKSVTRTDLGPYSSHVLFFFFGKDNVIRFCLLA